MSVVIGTIVGGPAARQKKIDNVVLVGVPMIGTAIAPYWFSVHAFTWVEFSSFLIGYILIGFGITIGLHRHFTHQSFSAGPILRFLLGAAASMAFQGSLLRWAADHRRHHATSDRSGDLHSPWIDSHGVEIDGARGFFHAHMGWLFDDVVTDLEVHGMNLRKDKLVVFFDNTHWYWASLSLAMPWAYGYLLGGLNAAWGCMIVGGFVRTFLFHHATWSVNSICHMIGGTKFEQHNRSKNNIAVALLTFGEGWHNNHHRFPRSAIHGLNRHEPDPSGFVITVLERMGLVKDVVRIGT